MAMVCPQCSGSFEQQLECPVCGVRLVYDASPRRDENAWQQTPWGRIFIGLVLAQGLAYGLNMMAQGTLQATEGGSDPSTWSTLQGQLLQYAMQGVSLLIGGMITGAGQQRGLLYGSFVGLVNGLILLFMQMGRGDVPNEVVLYLQPLLHLAFGATGGLIGTLIWKPLPNVRIRPLPAGSGRIPVPRARVGVWSGPISWTRVISGSALAVAGIVRSQTIVDFILEASEGKLSIATHLQGQLAIWEICAIAVLLGAGLAGATTRNGLKQGLLVGLGAGVVVIGVSLGNPKAGLNLPAHLLAGLGALTLVGGWFGSQLFPPVVANSRRVRPITS